MYMRVLAAVAALCIALSAYADTKKLSEFSVRRTTWRNKIADVVGFWTAALSFSLA